MNRFTAGLYIFALIGLPLLSWKGFDLGEAGDVATNGNSIRVVWVASFVMLVFWVICLRKLKQSLDFLRYLPVLFTLDETGIKTRDWIKTPWSEFEEAYYVNKGWSLTLKVRPESQFKDIKIKEEEIGLTAIEEIKSFMREYVPLVMTEKFHYEPFK